jgi:hypothetical protein
MGLDRHVPEFRLDTRFAASLAKGAVKIAIFQFGILIGIVFCLVISRLEYFRPPAAAEKREPMTERTTAVEPLSESEEQAGDIADNGADADLAELAAEQPRTLLPNEYSPEAVERYRAEATRLYYEQIAPRRQTVAAVAPTYAEVVEQPAAVQTYDPAPETIAYVQPTQVVVYPQPAQIVVFSYPRRFLNRCRPVPQPGALASNPHRRPHREGTHLNGSPAFRPAGSLAAGQRQNTGVSPCSSTQGFTSRGKR